MMSGSIQDSRRTRNCGFIFFVCIVGLVTAESAFATQNWNLFESAAGFQISYPSNWFRIGTSPISLQIMSGSRRVEGVIIPREEQLISVVKKEDPGYDDFIRSYKTENPDDSIISQRTIMVSGAAKNACREIQIIRSTDEVGPQTYYLQHHLYCRINKGVFVLTLTQWLADKFNDTSLNVSIEMMKSLRAHQ